MKFKKELIGSGDKITLFALPFLVIGLILNNIFPSWFDLGGPGPNLKLVSIFLFTVGLTLWIWSVVLIITKAAKGKLITDGPYSLVKHPIYTSVGLLVLPWGGVILNTWVGFLVGISLYMAARKYAPEEEKKLSKTFGSAWNNYRETVKIPWL